MIPSQRSLLASLASHGFVGFHPARDAGGECGATWRTY